MSEHLIQRRRLCIALAAMAGPAVAAGDEQARQVVEQADRIRNPQQPFQVTLRLVEYRNGQARQSATLRLHAKLQPATRRFRNLARFDFEHEFTTWLYRIVTNLAIDHLRKRRPAVSTSAEEEEEADLDLADPEGRAPSASMEQLETAERVRACIDRLAPHFRSVMILRELEGLPCIEIARIVGTTHVTVRWRLHRGRKLFLEEWERMESEAAKKNAPQERGTNSPSETP